MTIQTQWDLSQFYASANDPAIEKDIQLVEAAVIQFEKKWKNADFSDSTTLLSALREYFKIQEKNSGLKPILYFNYKLALDSTNTKTHGLLATCVERLTKAENKLVFFQLEIGKLSTAVQEKILADKKLNIFHYFLERIFIHSAHNLTEKEEQIENLLSQSSYSLWVNGVEKALHSRTIKFENKEIPLTEALNMLPRLETSKRRMLHTQIMEKASEVSEFAESEINAICSRKKVTDELHKYRYPYSSRVLSAENNEETVDNLLKVVSSYFPLSHRFYELKAKLLHLKKLTYADRAAQVGQIKRTYSFDESYQIVHDAFQSLDPEFAAILEKMVSKGQIDVYPKKGKQGGAFCSHGTGTPTMVLLNHVNSFESVTTFAHEMGHAIHSELSKKQPVVYQDYSLSTAETASTFFERIVFEKLIENFTDEEKIIALHDKVSDDINTIFRQIAVFNFELALHTEIRKKGFISKEEIGSLLNSHMSTYLGSVVEMHPEDGNFFVLWPHIRSFFYVYTYAFGQLVSKSLYSNVQHDSSYIQKVREFLEAGGSDTPENIFKKIGINVGDPTFFESGLTTIEVDIDLLEKMLK